MIQRCATHDCHYDDRNGCSFCPTDLARLLEEAKKASNYLDQPHLLLEPQIRAGVAICGMRLYDLIVEIEKKQRARALPAGERP